LFCEIDGEPTDLTDMFYTRGNMIFTHSIGKNMDHANLRVTKSLFF
jgi:hypothetical protein